MQCSDLAERKGTKKSRAANFSCPQRPRRRQTEDRRQKTWAGLWSDVRSDVLKDEMCHHTQEARALSATNNTLVPNEVEAIVERTVPFRLVSQRTLCGDDIYRALLTVLYPLLLSQRYIDCRTRRRLGEDQRRILGAKVKLFSIDCRA